MTAEVKYYLDVDDILAVRLECSSCHVSSSFPLAKMTQMPNECPHCRAEWVLPTTSTEKITNAFLLSLGRAAEALKGQRFKLSLEVGCEE